MISHRHFIVCAFMLGLFALGGHADANDKPFLHSIFSDNMVLQRGVKTPVWGWAAPGTKVRVTLDGKSVSCKAAQDGTWRAELPAHKAGGPVELSVTGGPETRILKNVLLGDVWLCSGQSNMEMGIRHCLNGNAEVAAANHPEIRLFSVPRKVAYEPEATLNTSNPLQSRWLVCSPETVGAGGWGGFSAAAYYFGRDLHTTLKVPIGLIHSSWGGTIAEAWTGADGLKTVDDFKDRIDAFEAQVRSANQGGGNLEKRRENWWTANDDGLQSGWANLDFDDADWKTLDGQPRIWEACGLPDLNGIVWFRKRIELPETWAGIEATLQLAMIDDMDTTYVNGVAVGGMQDWQSQRGYKVPAGLLNAGENVVAIRVLDTGGDGGLHGSAEAMKLTAPGQADVPLAGTWHIKVGSRNADLKPYPQQMHGGANQPTVLYNGMIAPLLPFAIKGAIWYQGEANAGRPEEYRKLLPAMITNWRAKFGVGDFPFLIVQLANFMGPQQSPAEGGWALIRDAQYATARDVPNCGLASATDIGEAGDIHPRNKQEVGRRLALIARAKTYGEKIAYSGPEFKSMKLQGDEIELTFAHVGGGLVARGDKVTGFGIAASDRNFVFAEARIAGDKVIVSAPGLTNPLAVCYAWASNPVGNLTNKEGLPAVPFMTKSE